MNLTLDALDGFDYFYGILLHVCWKGKLLGEGFILVHLNVTGLENMGPDWNSALNFTFVDYPDGIPLSCRKVGKLYVFGCVSDMNV